MEAQQLLGWDGLLGKAKAPCAIKASPAIRSLRPVGSGCAATCRAHPVGRSEHLPLPASLPQVLLLSTVQQGTGCPCGPSGSVWCCCLLPEPPTLAAAAAAQHKTSLAPCSAAKTWLPYHCCFHHRSQNTASPKKNNPPSQNDDSHSPLRAAGAALLLRFSDQEGANHCPRSARIHEVHCSHLLGEQG